MSFPCNGQNHRSAVADEANMANNPEMIQELERIYGKSINRIEKIGGIKTSTDIRIFFSDGKVQDCSLKTKANPACGSFDYINTTDGSVFDKHFPKSRDVAKKYRGSGVEDKMKKYDALKNAILTELNQFTSNRGKSSSLTEFFMEKVVNGSYKSKDLIIHTNKGVYRIAKIKLFDLLNQGGILVRRETGRSVKMSVPLDLIMPDGSVVDLGLRFRVHLNNGKTAWVAAPGENKGKSTASYLCMKFQQDRVAKNFNIQ